MNGYELFFFLISFGLASSFRDNELLVENFFLS